jgi:acetyl esterase/lipase
LFDCAFRIAENLPAGSNVGAARELQRDRGLPRSSQKNLRHADRTRPRGIGWGVKRAFAATFALTACHAAPPPSPAGPATVHADIVYVDGSHDPKHQLDVYAPPGAAGAPVMVFVHGGYWVSGDRRAPEHGAGLYGNVGQALAARGIVTVIPSYRLAPQVAVDGMLADVARAVAWTRREGARFGADPEALFLAGHSAGGHLVALLASDPQWLAAADVPTTAIRGVVALSAIWDVPDMVDAHDDGWNEAVAFPVFGRNRQRQRQLSPGTWLSAASARFLVVVAEDDFAYLVPQAHAAALALHVDVLHVPDADHLDLVRSFDTLLADTIANFVR